MRIWSKLFGAGKNEREIASNPSNKFEDLEALEVARVIELMDGHPEFVRMTIERKGGNLRGRFNLSQDGQNHVIQYAQQLIEKKGFISFTGKEAEELERVKQLLRERPDFVAITIQKNGKNLDGRFDLSAVGQQKAVCYAKELASPQMNQQGSVDGDTAEGIRTKDDTTNTEYSGFPEAADLAVKNMYWGPTKLQLLCISIQVFDKEHLAALDTDIMMTVVNQVIPDIKKCSPRDIRLSYAINKEVAFSNASGLLNEPALSQGSLIHGEMGVSLDGVEVYFALSIVVGGGVGKTLVTIMKPSSAWSANLKVK